jgi:hypothetical protein
MTVTEQLKMLRQEQTDLRGTIVERFDHIDAEMQDHRVFHAQHDEQDAQTREKVKTHERTLFGNGDWKRGPVGNVTVICILGVPVVLALLGVVARLLYVALTR